MPMIGLVDLVNWTLVVGNNLYALGNGEQHSLNDIRYEVNVSRRVALEEGDSELIESLDRFLRKAERHFEERGYSDDDVVTIVRL